MLNTCVRTCEKASPYMLNRNDGKQRLRAVVGKNAPSKTPNEPEAETECGTRMSTRSECSTPGDPAENDSHDGNLEDSRSVQRVQI